MGSKSKYVMEWYQKHPEQYNECKRKTREWYHQHSEDVRNHRRKTRLMQTIDGKVVNLKVEGKRDYPGYCELCLKKGHLVYHHWNDDNFALGLWLCLPCHQFAEKADKEGIVERYSSLKRGIESQDRKGVKSENLQTR